MFDKHRHKQAVAAYRAQLAQWEEHRLAYAELVQLARRFSGTTSDQIILKAGEALYYSVSDAGLIEERRGAGHYEGRSQGVSVPIGSIGGRSVRYRVGRSKGHYVQGQPHPTAVDRGTAHITDRRVVFQGRSQTRECAFTKLIAIERSDAEGTTTFSVANRQKPTTIAYGPAVAPHFDFRLDLALAHFRGTVPELVDQLETELAAIEAARPVEPASADQQ